MAYPEQSVSDLTTLENLSEETIVQELQSRFQNGCIYTYVGDVTVAVNPYRDINIYGDEHHRLYRETITRSACQPHIYWVANHACQRMVISNKKQVILISGESGAGKTETTKFIVEHVAHISGHQQTERLHKRILLVNPILEAFGNAKTVMNDNSSRFGKLIELFFNKNGAFKGAAVDTYLLEKARVVHHAPGDMTFHVFYYLIAGANEDERHRLRLEHDDTYRALRPSGGRYREASIFTDDQEMQTAKRKYEELRSTMVDIGMRSEDMEFINCMLAAILHLTDIEFEPVHQHTDGVDVINESTLDKTALLLMVNRNDLRDALIHNSHEVRGDISSDRSQGQAEEARDSLARSLYHGLFLWLVSKVNAYLKCPQDVQNMRSIGILDMSGFENLTKNGFDQLLINVANERLQYYFNEYLFSMEQRELAAGGVNQSGIDSYENNTVILNMLLGDPLTQGQTGLLGTIDEMSSLRQTTVQTLRQKLNYQFRRDAPYLESKFSGTNFFIQHFAGRVEYDARSFLEKNRDHLSSNLRNTINKSGNPLVVAMVETNTGRRRQETAISQFRNSLKKLIDHLSHSDALFVRCIRPNKNQDPHFFDADTVNVQLRYNGLMELAKMRRIGFPVRIELRTFLDRYQMLMMQPPRNEPRVDCEEVLRILELTEAEVGTEQVFLKEWQRYQLENHRRRFLRAVIFVQRRRRGQSMGDRFRSVVQNVMKHTSKLRMLTDSIPSSRTTGPWGQKSSGSRSIDGSSGGRPEVIGQTSPEPSKRALPMNNWNVMRTILSESDLVERNADAIVKYLKVLMYLVFAKLLLGGLVFSKLSLLNLASRITSTSTLDRYGIDQRNEHITLLLLCMAVPNVLGCVQYIHKALSGKHADLSVYTLIQCVVVEVLHTSGMLVLVLRVLPKTDMIRGLFLLCLSCSVPSIFKVFFGKTPISKPRIGEKAAFQDDMDNQHGEQRKVKRKKRHRIRLEASICNQVIRGLLYAFNAIAMLIQLAGIVALCIGNFDIIGTSRSHVQRNYEMKFGLYGDAWEVPLCLLLISIKWWENFVDRDLKVCGMQIPLLKVKANWHKHRHTCTVITSMVSLAVICISPFALFDNFKFEVPGGRRKGLPLDILRDYQSAIINVGASFIAYVCSIIVAKLCMQKFCFNLPLLLATPVSAVFIYLRCTLPPVYLDGYLWLCPEHPSSITSSSQTQWHVVLMLVFWVSSMIVGIDTWWSNQNRLDKTEKLFVVPTYCSAIIEQSMLLNRRRHDSTVDIRQGIAHFNESKHVKDQKNKSGDRKFSRIPNDAASGSSRSNKDNSTKPEEEIVPMIYACATLWHETKNEMTQLMKSIFRMDKHQCNRRLQRDTLKIYDPEYFDFQTHILFDDAMTTLPDGTKVLNKFVHDFISIINPAGSSVHKISLSVKDPVRTPTPYGGRLAWSLPGDTMLIVHLKDKDKIRHRKRWSQCMYMYYLLAYCLIGLSDDEIWEKRETQLYSSKTLFDRLPKEILRKADHTFLLALDGDVDFKPKAVRLLLDLMKKNKNVASACGRIHPIGSGPMVAYQVFGYAVAHWLQKVAEHVFGCVLCSPGCFSLFRGSALMDDNVMHRYLHTADQPREFIQFDQGEDRWLCTLLLQQGYRVEYCAGSDALTFAPESLSEYFTQQRRWITSTMANVLDLISSYQTTVERNPDISYFFMMYQTILFSASLLAPATIVTLIAGSYNSILGTPLLESYLLGFSAALFYTSVCLFCKNDTQIQVGILISAVYAIVMMLVVVAMIINSSYESIYSPNVAFLTAIVLLFLALGVLHPREFSCLLPGILYIFAIPFSLLFLMIYSICNMNVVSWGTREVPRAKTQEELDQEQRDEEERKERAKHSGLLNMFGLGNVVRDIKDFSKAMLTRSFHDGQQETNDLREKMMHMEELISVVIEKKEPRNELREILERKKNKTTSVTSDVSTEKKEKAPEPLVLANPEPEDKDNPTWIQGDVIKNGPKKLISHKEADFWTDMLSEYLHPIPSNKQQEKQIAFELKEMRNNVVAGMSMLNVLFIILIFLFQTIKETLGEEIFIPIPQEEGRIEFFEPVGLVFLGAFGLLLVVQFLASIWHRLVTIMHLMAITDIKWPCQADDSQSNQLEISLELIGKLSSLNPNAPLPFIEPDIDYMEDEASDNLQQMILDDQRNQYSQLDPPALQFHVQHNSGSEDPTEDDDHLNNFGVPIHYDSDTFVDEGDQHIRPGEMRLRNNRTRAYPGGSLANNFSRRYAQLTHTISRGGNQMVPSNMRPFFNDISNHSLVT